MQRTNCLSNRLLWIAEHVSKDSVLWDVGTDHAKLPVYLMENKRIYHAFASDIGEGPVMRARENVISVGLSDAIEVFCCDGLAEPMPLIPKPTNIAICGMGGETICKIISDSDYVRNDNIKLLLQPMTDFLLLRKFLAKSGFKITDEDIVFSEGRMYQCIEAEYTARPYTINDTEAELGTLNISRRKEIFLKYVNRRIGILKKCVEGKMISGADASKETTAIFEYEKILEGVK